MPLSSQRSKRSRKEEVLSIQVTSAEALHPITASSTQFCASVILFLRSFINTKDLCLTLSAGGN